MYVHFLVMHIQNLVMYVQYFINGSAPPHPASERSAGRVHYSRRFAVRPLCRLSARSRRGRPFWHPKRSGVFFLGQVCGLVLRMSLHIRPERGQCALQRVDWSPSAAKAEASGSLGLLLRRGTEYGTESGTENWNLINVLNFLYRYI